jgi:hypothetical protein
MHALQRVVAWLDRRRWYVLAAVVLHQTVLYACFLGVPSWDGLTYRIPPIVELVQHGALGLDKYGYWAFRAYVPFIELAHAPFLWAFGLRGVLIGFPLVVLPLCIVAIHSFVLRLTGDRTSAFFGAAAYAVLPLVGEGAIAGYVDFAFCGLLCFFLDGALAALAPARTRSDLARLALGTLAFTLSRGQAVYIATILLALLSAVAFLERDGRRFVPASLPASARVPALNAFAVGAIPAVVLQLYKLLKYGGPIYPYQFQLFGVPRGSGVSMAKLLTQAGIPDDSARSLAVAAFHGWLWPTSWPPAGFYDSRNLGAGLVLWVMIAVFVPALRGLDRRARALLVALVVLSVVARDYCHPRWASTLLAAVVVVVGTGMAQLLAWRALSARIAFVVLALVLGAHVLRPELELSMLGRGGIGPRLNAASSPWFIHGPDAYDPWPDEGVRFLVVQQTADFFVLPVYGPRLTNEVVGTVPAAELGPRCERLVLAGALEPDVVLLDDLDLTKRCDRVCAREDAWHCVAWRLRGPKP